MQEEGLKKGKKRIRQKREHADAAVWRERIRWIGVEILWGCGAWILGQAPLAFGTYPLGLALLCGSSRHTLAILIGLICTAVSNMQDPLIYVFTYLAAAFVRVFASMILDTPEMRPTLPASVCRKLRLNVAPIEDMGSETRMKRMRRDIKASVGAREKWRAFRRDVADVFGESVFLRMATAAICALVLGLYYAIVGEFQYYDLFALIFAVILCPAAAMVYSICTDRGNHRTWLFHVSEGALLFSLVYAARTVTMLGLPLSPMMALFFSLYICYRRGAIQGVVAGILGGVAVAPLQTPAFVLAALVYLLFCKLEREVFGTLPACLAAVAWIAYVDGIATLLWMVPSALLVGTVFTILHKATPDREEPEEEESTACARFESTRRQDANERFRGISDAFSSLSEMFYNLSDRFRRPGTLDLRRLCDTAFDKHCADCPNKTVCWGLEYASTLQTVNELISSLHTKGKVSAEQIAGPLCHRCARMDEILTQINRECARLTGEMLRDNRNEIFAMDYEATAAIINDALEEEDGEYRFDEELEKRIREYLSDAGVSAGGVTVYGKRRRRILIRGVGLEDARVSFETLRSDVGELCGSELATPGFEVEQGVSTMILSAKQKISVRGAQNNVSADGGVSGDTVNLFSNKKDYFYALISDGMGSGKEAALTSNICSVFMEKMLRAGNRAETSLRMLNNMIRSRTSNSAHECSSTIDLLELDLMTGEGSFVKGGAAPSFVIRDGVVQRLQAGTVPIGIICTLDVQKNEFPLCAGDTVVMISDGILQGDPECEWLTEYLSGVGGLTPDEIVYHICVHAAGREDHDDCSAIALRIEKSE